MLYVKRRKVEMKGYDKFIIALWYICAIIWIANVYHEFTQHNVFGAVVRIGLVILYLFLPINKYYALKHKQES